MYIFWFLHQTTTDVRKYLNEPKLYIFWFLHQTTTRVIIANFWVSCISFDSYIKPQPHTRKAWIWLVVYLLIPTSNHNYTWKQATQLLLYIFWFLHQTTTYLGLDFYECLLYIFWFLHQTTTGSVNTCVAVHCISFDSYIKPQPPRLVAHEINIVYLLIPTSNHNYFLLQGTHVVLYIFWFLHQTTTPILNQLANLELYIFWFLHQTTTYRRVRYKVAPLYIFWFLHQTTTSTTTSCVWFHCISFDSYIKPQQPHEHRQHHRIVYLLIPTSNHNEYGTQSFRPHIVYLLIPTSNHNFWLISLHLRPLYIFWFLHQTTTSIVSRTPI